MGRPKGSFKKKLKNTTIRQCLKCKSAFTSRGPGNRLCHVCNKENERLFNVPIHTVADVNG